MSTSWKIKVNVNSNVNGKVNVNKLECQIQGATRSSESLDSSIKLWCTWAICSQGEKCVLPNKGCMGGPSQAVARGSHGNTRRHGYLVRSIFVAMLQDGKARLAEQLPDLDWQSDPLKSLLRVIFFHLCGSLAACFACRMFAASVFEEWLGFAREQGCNSWHATVPKRDSTGCATNWNRY